MPDRIAIGPQQGRKALTLQILPAQGKLEENSSRVAKASGFSLHAGVAAEAYERHKLGSRNASEERSPLPYISSIASR